eukprot:6603875-Prymnesium_polylepis.2
MRTLVELTTSATGGAPGAASFFGSHSINLHRQGWRYVVMRKPDHRVRVRARSNEEARLACSQMHHHQFCGTSVAT